MSHCFDIFQTFLTVRGPWYSREILRMSLILFRIQKCPLRGPCKNDYTSGLTLSAHSTVIGTSQNLIIQAGWHYFCGPYKWEELCIKFTCSYFWTTYSRVKVGERSSVLITFPAVKLVLPFEHRVSSSIYSSLNIPQWNSESPNCYLVLSLQSLFLYRSPFGCSTPCERPEDFVR